MTTFCSPNCKHLNPTEEEQDADEFGRKDLHFCEKYEKTVYHGAFHPMIMSPDECTTCQCEGETFVLREDETRCGICMKKLKTPTPCGKFCTKDEEPSDMDCVECGYGK